MSDPLFIVRGPEAGGNFEREWTNGTVKVHLLSDVGRKREHNEDSCAMCSPNDAMILDRLGIVIAVADGMGGASAGEHASQLALNSFIEHYYENLTDSIPKALSAGIKHANRTVNNEANENPEYDGMGTTLSVVILHGDNAYIGQVGDSRVYIQKNNTPLVQLTDSIPKALSAGIKHANRTVNNEANENPEYDGMGTTLSVVILHGDNAYIGQVGDSRVYIQKNNTPLVQLTEDHSLVWEQLRAGIINEEEAKNHSLRNLITRAIGIRAEVDVDLFSLKIEQGDVLIVCSDGLCGMIDDDAINDGIDRESAQATNRVLVGKALDAGGADNITVATVHAKSSLNSRELQPGCEQITNNSGSFIDRIKKLFG